MGEIPLNGEFMSNIQEITKSAEKILNAIQTTVDDMKDNDRIKLDDLAQTVGLLTGADPRKVAILIQFYTKESDAGYVAKGAHGGYVKGIKKVRAKKSTTDGVED